MKSIGTAILTLIVGILSANAWACGDSLYRVGKGISYRVYTAPLPGSVLVYGQTEGARQLAEALSDSGHSVEVVASEMDLSLKMQSGDYDVVIASYGDHAAVESNTVASGTKYLPVALSKEEEQVAEQSYGEVLLADRDEIKDYLKAIHKTLKNKAS